MKGRIFIKFYVVVNYSIVSLYFKFHEYLCINVPARVVNVCPHKLLYISNEKMTHVSAYRLLSSLGNKQIISIPAEHPVQCSGCTATRPKLQFHVKAVFFINNVCLAIFRQFFGFDKIQNYPYFCYLPLLKRLYKHKARFLVGRP